MKIRPLKAGDVDCLELQNIDHWILDEISNLHMWEKYAVTVLNDVDQPIGIAGLSLENGIGTGWMIGSRELRENRFYLHRTMKCILRELLQHPKLKCIHVIVEQKSPVAAEWLKRLGFKRGPESENTVKYVMED